MRMKILFLINSIPPEYGGGYLRVFKTAARFKEYDWLYKIATFTKREKYTTNIRNIKINDILFLKGFLFTSLFYLPWHIIKYRSKFDVFYVASVRWYSTIPSLIAKILGKKVIHGVTLSLVDSPAGKPSSIFKVPYYWFKNCQFKIADFIFVNSPLVQKECISCGYDEKVVKLINNPVDTQKFRLVSNEEKRNLLVANDLPVDAFTILFVGSFNKRKGCDLFPILFKILFSKTSTKINFIMCGQKGYPETNSILSELDGIFRESGNTLKIMEEVSDTSKYYKMSNLFLFPTTNEGLPNVVLEAMASGCMILCNLLPGITDYILSDVFIVKNNDITEYVERIIDYIDNQPRFQHLIERNRKKIEDSFSIENVDSTIQQILNS